MLNVLIVDDDNDISEMVSLILAASGIDSNSLNSGNHLFPFLETGKPDIILMDIFLGDCDGRVLCSNLKNMERFKDIPILLYSAGNITPTSIRESLADDFIIKPFDISDLLGRINTIGMNRVYT